jgi:hypothetical protein
VRTATVMVMDVGDGMKAYVTLWVRANKLAHTNLTFNLGDTQDMGDVIVRWCSGGGLL